VSCRDLRPYGTTAQSRAIRILKSCSDLARLRSALWTGQSTCDGHCVAFAVLGVKRADCIAPEGEKMVESAGLEPARSLRRRFPKPEGFHLPAYDSIETGRDGVTRTRKARRHRLPKSEGFHLPAYVPTKTGVSTWT
jgi:hypothetical protein